MTKFSKIRADVAGEILQWEIWNGSFGSEKCEEAKQTKQYHFMGSYKQILYPLKEGGKIEKAHWTLVLEIVP